MSDLSATIVVEFEELPLLTEVRRTGVTHGMLVNCAAEIEFYSDGEWSISRIWMEAFTGNSMATVPTEGVEIKQREGVNVEAPLWTLAHTALLRHRKDRIESAVTIAIEDGAFDESESDRGEWTFAPLIPANAEQHPEADFLRVA